MKHPFGWKREILNNVSVIQTGLAKGKAVSNSPARLPYLRVANVQDGFFDLTEIKEIEVEQSQIERYRLFPGDILLTEGGDRDKLGRGTLWEGQIPLCLHQNHIFVVRPNENIIFNKFLAYLFSSPLGKKYFLSCAKQSTNLASINSTQLRNFPLAFPCIHEQKAIATILSTWDEAIEKTERLIELKEQQFRNLQNKLIKNRFRSGSIVKLGDVARIPIKQKLENLESKKLLTVKLHCIGIEANDRIKPKLSETGRPYYSRKAGEILIGRQNFHNGGIGIVPENLDGGIASNAITSIEGIPGKLHQKFLYWVLARENYYQKIGHIMDGTGQKELSEKQLLNLSIYLPPPILSK